MTDLIDRRGLAALAASTWAGLTVGVGEVHATDSAAPSPYFIHLFTGPDGLSRIEELDPRQAGVKLPYLYRAMASEVSVLTYPAGHRFDWHLTRDIPRLIIQLRGLSVTIVDDGGQPGSSYHPLAAGSIMLAEDKSGRGHRGVIFGDEDAVSMQVDLVV